MGTVLTLLPSSQVSLGSSYSWLLTSDSQIPCLDLCISELFSGRIVCFDSYHHFKLSTCLVLTAEF